MRIYGLTGGTGSGKTEAARRFAAHGIPIIDADAVGHEVIAPGGAAEQAVVAEFGPAILTDGAIDRSKLGTQVFRDDDARRKLNSIVHPAIGMAIAMRCAALAVTHELAIIDAALIAENGKKEDYLSGLILVLCPDDLRVERLVAHRGIDDAEARRRIAAQTPPEKKLALADWVIDNSGGIDALHARVDEIAEELKNHAG